MDAPMASQEKRTEQRAVYAAKESAFVELKIVGRPESGRMYDLKVNDCSKNGLGMLVTQKQFDLLNILDEGDTLKDISFFAPWKVFKVDGTVRHKTRIEQGAYKGCYILGIKSHNPIDYCSA